MPDLVLIVTFFLLFDKVLNIFFQLFLMRRVKKYKKYIKILYNLKNILKIKYIFN